MGFMPDETLVSNDSNDIAEGAWQKSTPRCRTHFSFLMQIWVSGDGGAWQGLELLGFLDLSSDSDHAHIV